MIKKIKIINFDDATKKKKKKKDSLKWLYIPDLFRILTTGGSVSGKTNALLNLIKHKDDYDYNKLFKC